MNQKLERKIPINSNGRRLDDRQRQTQQEKDDPGMCTALLQCGQTKGFGRAASEKPKRRRRLLLEISIRLSSPKKL
jgi:hypothetical protein